MAGWELRFDQTVLKNFLELRNGITNFFSPSRESSKDYRLLIKSIQRERERSSCESSVTVEEAQPKTLVNHTKCRNETHEPVRRMNFFSSWTYRPRLNPKRTGDFFCQFWTPEARIDRVCNEMADFFRTFSKFQRNCKQTVSKTVFRAS